jgi:hypothetical protein
MSDETTNEQAQEKVATMPCGPTAAIGGTGSPASIVPVRTYAGETEDQALERHGIDRSQSGPEILFVHLD